VCPLITHGYPLRECMLWFITIIKLLHVSVLCKKQAECWENVRKVWESPANIIILFYCQKSVCKDGYYIS
jgi:hypothetical protein